MRRYPQPPDASLAALPGVTESDLTDVVYLEQLTSALYLDKREDVVQYEKALKELQQDSPGPDESRDLLRGLLQLS